MWGITIPSARSIAMGGMIFIAIDQHKSGYSTWHKRNIEILTSNTESTSKTGPDDIQYITI